MKQAIHIFRKDLRYLWREVCTLLLLAGLIALSGVLGRASFYPFEILFILASGWLVARLIQAEMLVGDNQFWITRPYSWRSLLGAKIAFILVIVQIPFLLAQTTLVIADGFSFWKCLPGLLWVQVLIWTCMSLPLVALASATSGLVALILTVLLVPAIGLAIDLSSPFVRIDMGMFLGPLDWVKDTFAYVGAIGIAGVVIYLQYRKRSTGLSRAILIGATALVAVAYVYFPWSIAFAVQSNLSKNGNEASTLQISLAEPGPLLVHGVGFGDQARIGMQLAVDGVPAGDEIRADALNVEFHWPDGRVSTSRLIGLEKRSIEGNVFEGRVPVDGLLIGEKNNATLSIRGSIYLTLFGNGRSRTIAVTEKPVNAVDNLRCSVSTLPGRTFFCVSPFRWPAGVVSATLSKNDVRQLGWASSYSPFPAELNLIPFASASPLGSPSVGSEATVSIKEPIAHVRRDFSLGEVHLKADAPYQISR